MLEVKNVSKSYSKGAFAVSDLSFTVEKGHVYGFLGANGAGKTTTMNIIAGALSTTLGSVSICSHDILTDPIEAKRHIGYLPENPPLYAELTVREYLDFVGGAKGIPTKKRASAVKKVMIDVGVYERADELISTLSKGYKQRVGIAQAILGDPDLVILDEPTVGLDPRQVVEIRNLIKKIGVDRTVILSSHILSEVDEICDRLIIISGGRLCECGELADIRKKYSLDGWITVVARMNAAKMREILLRVPGIGKFNIKEHLGETTATVKQSESLDLRERIFNTFAASRCPLIEMKLVEPSLEDIFLEITDNITSAHEISKSRSADSDKAKTVTKDTVKKSEKHDNKRLDIDDDEDEDGEDYRPLFRRRNDEKE